MKALKSILKQSTVNILATCIAVLAPLHFEVLNVNLIEVSYAQAQINEI